MTGRLGDVRGGRPAPGASPRGPRTGTPVPRIDVHAHFLPSFYRERLRVTGRDRPDGLHLLPSWSPDEALLTMEALAVDAAVLSLSSPGLHLGGGTSAVELARAVNDDAARMRRAYPDRFGFLAALPLPDVPASVAELRRAVLDLGADGAVVDTHVQGRHFSSCNLDPLLAELDRLGAVALLHPTYPPSAAELTLGHPRAMIESMTDLTRSISYLLVSDLLDRHPGVNVIVGHAGPALPTLARDLDVLHPLLGTAPSRTSPATLRRRLRRLYFDLPGSASVGLGEAVGELVPSGHALYGSNWPFTPREVCAALAEQLERDQRATADDRSRDTLARNASALFPRFRMDGPAGGAALAGS
jgi:predicted TIM-barrel fold metal-dependent hydrolase